MHLLRILIFAFAILFVFSNINAQDDEIKVDSSIVRLNVGVVDGRGRPITTLGRGSFTVFEDGVRQEVSRFEATTAPFSVVMLLDMSGSTKSYRPNIKLSASRFLDALAPDDRVAVIEFYSKFRMLNDFTVNKNVAAQSIELANGEGDTDLYKAINFALKNSVRRPTVGKRLYCSQTVSTQKPETTIGNFYPPNYPTRSQPLLNLSKMKIS